jgi:hypothetical protein
MPEPVASPPEMLPLLSRGRHRNPRKGACFMEMASVLAGERWSDHPRCTHPLLGNLARLVNDCTSDDHRHELATLIPSVVGLTSDDPRMDARIALRCACAAMPVASEERQNALGVSILSANRVLAEIEGRPFGDLEPGSVAALESAPRSARWAEQFVRGARQSTKGFRRHAAPSTVRFAVRAIAEACVSDPDAILRHLLADVIEDCSALCRPDLASTEAQTNAVPTQRAEV